MPKKKKKNHSNWSLILTVLLGVITILTSILIQKTVIFLSRAASPPLNMLPSMKQSKLDYGLPTEAVPTVNDTDPTTGATITPAPIPTTGQQQGTTCTLDRVKNPQNCSCPDLEGFKCGDKTNGVNNFHYKVNVSQSDTQGIFVAPKGMYLFRTSYADYAVMKNNPQCVEWCIGKPVIYLYPTVPTIVDVSLRIPGEIFISDPTYPTNGWQNVLANPNGSLLYKGNTYRELYYETKLTTNVKAPTTGIVIPTEELESRLATIVTKLGLKEAEKEEFLEYWLPNLYALNAPYIQFSLIDDAEKERIDHVDISPQPDTFIAFLAYFKPLWTYSVPAPLMLPDTPPARTGFTAVEWGGTIENVVK